jgi:hypothetical protein
VRTSRPHFMQHSSVAWSLIWISFCAQVNAVAISEADCALGPVRAPASTVKSLVRLL